MKKKSKRLIKIAGVALLVAAALGIGTTGAAVFHKMSMNNQVRTPTVKVNIEEEISRSPADGKKKKEVKFTNTGTADVFVRIAYAEMWTYQDPDSGEVTVLPNKTNGTGIAAINWISDSAWDRDWVNGGDGWYYYRHVLQPKAATAEVMTSVTFPKSDKYPDPRYAEADYQLHFQVEAVQASDELAVSKAAVREVFEKDIRPSGSSAGVLDEAGWRQYKHDAEIGWTDMGDTEGGN